MSPCLLHYFNVRKHPDGNGIELYWDRPRDEWPLAPDGSIALVTDPLDLRGLLATIDAL